MANRWSGIKSVIGMEQQRFILICAEGISQAGMLAFQFGAAREREKLAKRVSHRLSSKDGKNKAQEKLQDYMRCTVSENESAYFPKLVNRVRFLKEEKKGVGQMCEIFDQVRQEGIEYGRQEGEQKIIFQMFDLLQEPEKISELTGEPLSKIYEIQKKYIRMRESK